MSEAEHLRPATKTLAEDVRLKWLRWLVALGRIGGPDDGQKYKDRYG